jgi:predicted DNA-binding protein
MAQARRPSPVVTLRVSAALGRRIERAARRSRRTKSAVVREVLEGAFGIEPRNGLADEARRESLLVSGRAAERQTLRFIAHAADDRGWR